MVIRIDLKKILAFFLAMVPFFRNYAMGGINIGLFVILVSTVYFVYKNINSGSYKTNKCIVLPVIMTMCFYSWLSFFIVKKDQNLTWSETGLQIFLFYLVLIFEVLILADEETRKQHNHYLENISIFMTFVIAFQYFAYYGAGLTFGTGNTRGGLIPFQGMLIESAKAYIKVATMTSEGLFRPSAFFLEPSHYSQYCILGLASLFGTEEKIITKKKILVSLGIVLTTSGIGMAAVALIWFAYLYLYNKDFNKKKMGTIILFTIVAILGFFIMYSRSSGFKASIDRVIAPGDGYNAVAGRLGTSWLVKSLHGEKLVWGLGFDNVPTYGSSHERYYVTGIIQLILCQGIVGTIIFAGFALYIIAVSKVKLPTASFLVVLDIVLYIIGTNWFGTLTIISYIPFLFYSYNKDVSSKQEGTKI